MSLVVRTRRGTPYGVRWYPIQPHRSLGIGLFVWPLRSAHLSLHLPFGVLVVGMVG